MTTLKVEVELALLDAVSEILSAYVTNNNVDHKQLPHLVAAIRDALKGENVSNDGHLPLMDTIATVTSDEAADGSRDAQREPAVEITASVTDAYVVCLECGAQMKTLRRHLMSAHNLDEKSYRERWSLSKEHPIVAPSYTRRRQQVAKDIGLGSMRGKTN